MSLNGEEEIHGNTHSDIVTPTSSIHNDKVYSKQQSIDGLLIHLDRVNPTNQHGKGAIRYTDPPLSDHLSKQILTQEYIELYIYIANKHGMYMTTGCQVLALDRHLLCGWTCTWFLTGWVPLLLQHRRDNQDWV